MESAKLKLERAYELLQEFNREWTAFLAREPYGAVSEIDAETGQEVLRLKVNERPPVRLSVLMGDFVQNLRSSLDHLVRALALSDSKTPRPDNYTEFPIFDTRNNNAIRKRIRCLPTTARDAIERMQPYHAGEQRHQHPLWVLYRLANIDKHKQLPLVIHELTFEAGTPDSPSLSGVKVSGVFEEGHVFPWPTFFSRTESDVKEQAKLSFAIVLDDARMPPLPVDHLDGLYEFIRNNIFEILAELVPKA